MRQNLFFLSTDYHTLMRDSYENKCVVGSRRKKPEIPASHNVQECQGHLF